MCNKEIYGYRRIHCLLRKDGIIVSEKIVRRIMNEEQLIVKAARKRKYKGCSPDNSACEGFFGRLKNEMFYGRNWNHASIDSFIHKLDEYIHWYNETRIKISLGGMSPFQYRRSLGIAI